MKKYTQYILFLFFVLASVSCNQSGIDNYPKPNTQPAKKKDEKQSSPRLFMKASYIFDFFCQQSDFKVKPDTLNEMHQKMMKQVGRFQEAWDQFANDIVAESERTVGKKFTRKEYSVALSSCGVTPQGPPVFLVSVLPYLSPEAEVNGIQYPLSMNSFVSMVHHELLHPLFEELVLSSDFQKNSNLLKKYENESFNVKQHLHLMAAQKQVYSKLKNKVLMEATDILYASIGGDYQRTWEIISDEGPEAFVAETQSFFSQ